MGIMTSLFRSLLRLPALGLAFAIGLAGLLLPAAALAEAGLSLQPSHQWLDDPAGDLPPLEALARTGQWQPGKHGAANRGYVDHPVWFRFDVEQNGEAYYVNPKDLKGYFLYYIQAKRYHSLLFLKCPDPHPKVHTSTPAS